MKVYLGVKAAKYPDGTELNDVMKYNEYGTEKIPPRPVLRIAAEKVITELPKIKGEESKSAIETYLTNLCNQPPSQHKRLEQEFLRKIGQAAAAEAKRIIKEGVELQRNAPSTIKQKGPGKPPLFDEGLMIKNISYEVAE